MFKLFNIFFAKRYDKAFEIDYAKLVGERFSGEISLLENVSVDVLARIQNGAKASKALPRLFRKCFDFF